MWGQAGWRRQACKPQQLPPGTAPEDVDLLPPRHAAASLPAPARWRALASGTAGQDVLETAGPRAGPRVPPPAGSCGPSKPSSACSELCNALSLSRPRRAPAKLGRADTEQPQSRSCVRAGHDPAEPLQPMIYFLGGRWLGQPRDRATGTSACLRVLQSCLTSPARVKGQSLTSFARASSLKHVGTVAGGALTTPRAARTHCVGWTSGTAPSRRTTGPLGLRTFLMEEIFSRSNLLIRLKPTGQSGGGETWPWHSCRRLTVSRQGAEPVPVESGLRGAPVCGARGAFPTCCVLILVPDQILVPELRARLPCKVNQHITAVSPRAGGGCTSRVRPCGAPQTLGVLGCC